MGSLLCLWEPRTNWAGEAHIPLWFKGEKAGVWNFKEKIDNSQVNEKEQMCDKQTPLGSPGDNGARMGV